MGRKKIKSNKLKIKHALKDEVLNYDKTCDIKMSKKEFLVDSKKTNTFTLSIVLTRVDFR